MSDWPLSPIFPGWSPAIGTRSTAFAPGTTGGAAASATWPTANLAIFIPFTLSAPYTVTQMFLWNGATATGNFDLGIYDHVGTKLVSAGSTAQSGTSVIQVVNVTDTQLGPGLFYMALAMDGTSGTVARTAPARTAFCKILGMAQMASAFPLPTTATYATVANSFIPFFGFTDRSVM